MPSFLELKQDVYRRTGQTSAPATEVSTRIGSFVNRWNRKVLSMKGMEPLRRVTVPIASVANQATYGVVLQSLRFMYEITTQRRIYDRTVGWYRTNYPDPSRFTGTPEYFVPLGSARYHTRPSAASQLFIVSTGAGDTGTVKIEAIRSTGYRVSLSHTLTGTTPVALSATITDVIDIVDIRLSAAQTGDVTVTQGSGGTELAKIPIGQTYPRYQRFALAPTPSQVITYQIDGIADIVDLSNDYDEPFENPDFHDILVDGAVYDEWTTRGRANEARSLLDGGSPNNPTPASIMGRIQQLRGSLLEWPQAPDGIVGRSTEDGIRLPLS